MRKIVLPFLLTIFVLFSGCHNSVQIENNTPSQEIEITSTSDSSTSTAETNNANTETTTSQNKDMVMEAAEATKESIVSSDSNVSDGSTTVEETISEENISIPADMIENNNTEEEPTVLIEPTVDIGETEPAEIPATIEMKKIGNLQYYLYSPKNPTNDMPLIIYLHGGTNKKANAEALLTTEGFPKYLYEGYYGDLRAYVAVPKLSNNYNGWVDIYEQIRNLIKDLNKNCGISMSKVSLTGHSMGGSGTYQLQVKLPKTFACIAPISGSIGNTEENLSALAKTKIWAFVGTNDTIVEPESSLIIISALQEKGANAQITELNDATHFDVPALVYKNNDLINWLVNCGS